MSDILFFFAYYVFRYRYKVVVENLAYSFPTKSPKEIKQIARKFYLNLTDIIVETLKSYTITRQSLQKRIHFTNPEVLQTYIDNEQSVLVMASHLCNWEWQLLGCQAFFNAKVDTVYKTLANPTIDKIMRHIRGRLGDKPIPMQSAVREIVRRKKQTYIYGLAADQTPFQHDNNLETTFLHQKTQFYTGTARIAELTQFPVVYAVMKRVKRGSYTLTFIPLGLPPYPKGDNSIIIQYIQLLEKYIQEAPSDWLWSHKRWKYTRN